MSEFKKTVTFQAAFDKRDPNPHKNYGIHGVEIRFVLQGSKGATQFLIYTDWHLPYVQKELKQKQRHTLTPILKHNGKTLKEFTEDDVSYETYKNDWMLDRIQPMGADIGYHSPVPMYEDQPQMEHCDLLPEGKCYYDGSGSRASEFIPTFLAGGDEAVWKMLEEEYNERFREEIK